MDLAMSDIQQAVEIVLRVSVVAFMAGNLLAIGLETDLKAALAPLADVRFVVTAALLDVVFCPGLAWLIAKVLPIAQPYANGLLLIGLAPAAPFLPMMVRRAGGNLAYTAAFMLIAAIGTVLLMPLAVPLIVPGLSVDPWTVAKPLLVLLFLPLAIGMALKTAAPGPASRLLRIVRPIAGAATVLLLLAIAVRYFEGFMGAIGSYAIAAQLLYAVGLLLGAHAIGAGLPAGQRSVLSLGACTRNLGAALAPLLITPADPRAMVMVALAVPITLGVTYLAAGWLAQPAGREPT
jgi:predicted Na+-dependent transporter